MLVKNERLKKIGASVLIVTLFLGTFFAGGKILNDFEEDAYAAEDYGTVLTLVPTKGSVASATHDNSTSVRKWQLTFPEKAVYKIELWGPGSSAGGGYVSGTGVFDVTDTVYITLGPKALDRAVAAMGGVGGSGYQSGNNGGSGSYNYNNQINSGGGALGLGSVRMTGESDIYMADVRLNNSSWNAAVLVAGGSGARGGWGYNTSTLGGSGGPGGMYTSILGGTSSEIGNRSDSNGEKGRDVHGHSTNGRLGSGGGGGGGSNFVDASFFPDYLSIGNNNIGVSMAKITYMGPYIPQTESEFIHDGLLKIAAAIAAAPAGGSSGQIMTINVVKNKEFNITVPNYDGMGNANKGGVTVVDSVIGDGVIQVSGTLSTSGYQDMIINGRLFVFHVVEEPDSSNITVLFH